MRVFYEAGDAARIRQARKHGHDEEAEQLLDAYRQLPIKLSRSLNTNTKTCNIHLRDLLFSADFEESGRFSSVNSDRALVESCSGSNARRYGLV